MDAVGHLSPLARTRTRPTFNITKPASDNVDPIEFHLSDLASNFAKVWGTALPIFFDFPRYGPDAKGADGRHPVEYFFDCVRQWRILGIPVAGPETVRGPGLGYLEAVGHIAHRDGRGAGIRIPYRDFSKADTLGLLIDETLGALSLNAPMVDVFLDFEALVLLPPQEQSEEHLLSVATDAFRAINGRSFRNVILCGSSIPVQVGKLYNWNPLIIPRTTLKVWQILVEREENPPKFGDNGVIFTHDGGGGKSGPPPSRVRLSTSTDYVLCRAPRGNYRKLCASVLKRKDFDETLRAWGISELLACGTGRGNEGNATMWVSRDTNSHDEGTSAYIEKTLLKHGRTNGLTFADPESYPWLQRGLDMSARGQERS
jgi:hypothetical protein